MAWASELPFELTCKPMGVVVLTGLDLVYNAMHKTIWDSFCNNRRSDRVPMKFLDIPADHEYPKCRPKRTSYEWYIPKGILKTGWMKKHLEKVPAVVVVFFDLDWDETMWKEKQMECATRVEIVRNSLLGRSTKVCMVLIQKNIPLPPGEDMIASERAASLCTACELSSKSLFVLPLTDHLLGYTIRLENAFYELVQNYYHTEARKVKAHKDLLNKTTHQLLFVRHQFKIAFFNEIKQDTHIALKHYKQAYGHVLELRMHDTNLLEVKSIAGFINYKICRLSFQHNTPLDAISQFRRHIDFFKSKSGNPLLLFEHSAWMSKQFQLFGDLFDEAIKLGLTAIQTQHPGIYYQQAGHHAITRKQLANKLCERDDSQPVSLTLLEGLDNLDYYGQRPWRQGHQSIDPPDANKERDGILAFQSLESKVDHSTIIIPLLSSAVSQFKKYKSPRMKRYLMVQMCEEYTYTHDYRRALTLLMRVTWEYRVERWWGLLTSVLNTALKCAYLTASLQDYMTVALELVGKYTENSKEEKIGIQKSLISLMNNETPELVMEHNEAELDKARMLWKEVMSHPESFFTIEMNTIVPFVECRSQFIEDSFAADEPIRIRVFLRSHAPLPVAFRKLSVCISNQIHSKHCVIDQSEVRSESPDKNRLYLSPNKVYIYDFSFLCQAEDIDKSLEVTSIALEYGSDQSPRAVLQWMGGGSEPVSFVPFIPSVTSRRRYSAQNAEQVDDRTWNQIEIISSTRVVPRPARTEVVVNHDSPALTNEFYQMEVKLLSRESSETLNTRLSFGLNDSNIAPSTQIVITTDVQSSVRSRAGLQDIRVGQLKPGEQFVKKFFIQTSSPENISFLIQVLYDINIVVDGNTMSCSCCYNLPVVVPVVDPFKIMTSIKSLKFDHVENVHTDEPFLLMTEVQCTSAWPVEIALSSLELHSGVQLADNDEFQSQLENLVLKKGESCTETICLQVPQSAAVSSTLLGRYVLKWRRRRDSGSDLPFVQSSVVMPTVNVQELPIFISVDMPAFGNVQCSVPVTYHIHNRTLYSQLLDVNMESSEGFMFSGHRQVQVRVLPGDTYSLHYNFVPLLSGSILLPRLRVNIQRYPDLFVAGIERMLPTRIFVLPRQRTSGLLQWGQ